MNFFDLSGKFGKNYSINHENQKPLIGVLLGKTAKLLKFTKINTQIIKRISRANFASVWTTSDSFLGSSSMQQNFKGSKPCPAKYSVPQDKQYIRAELTTIKNQDHQGCSQDQGQRRKKPGHGGK